MNKVDSYSEFKIEIMGDIQKFVNGNGEEPVNLEEHKRYVIIDGMNLPVLDLEYEYKAYLKMGRVEKAMLLKGHISHS